MENIATAALPNAEERLLELGRRIAEDFELTGYPSTTWTGGVVGRFGEQVFDVVVQGAGMQGIAVAHALRRHLISKVLVIDENDEGFEGPWLRYARMHFLRTPKLFVGPDMGLPSLSFRAWYVTRHGEAAWKDVVNIPKLDWVAYLNWYRRVTKLLVWNSTKAVLIEPVLEDGTRLFRIHVRKDGSVSTVLARKVVRAAGIMGAGGGRLPHHLVKEIPKCRYDHSADAIDFRKLSDRRVGVLGAGASAYDNAAACLEAGAASVVMFMRRTKPSIKFENLLSTLEWMKHYAELSDVDRWRLHSHLLKFSAPPPPYAIQRVERFSNFEIKAGHAVTSVTMTPQGALSVRYGSSSLELDHLIFSTGFDVNLANVPELEPLRSRIMLWSDRGEEFSGHPQGNYPYLGASFEYLEKEPGTMPHLRNIYEFGPAATLSLGMTCVGLNSLSFGVQRLVDGITRDFFFDSLSNRIDGLLAVDPNSSLEEGAGKRIASLR